MKSLITTACLVGACLSVMAATFDKAARLDYTIANPGDDAVVGLVAAPQSATAAAQAPARADVNWSEWTTAADKVCKSTGSFSYDLDWYFSGTQDNIEIERRYNLADPAEYQLHLKNWGNGEIADGLIIHVDKSGEVKIPVQDTGLDIKFTNGTFRLFVTDFNEYRALNHAGPDPAAEGYYDKLTHSYHICITYMVEVDGTCYSQKAGFETFTIDMWPEYEFEAAFVSLDTEVPGYTATFSTAIGSGLDHVKVAISSTLTEYELIEAIEKGTVDTRTLQPGTKSVTLPLNGDGTYTFAGVGYLSDGTPGGTTFSSVKALDLSDWKPAGNATLYDGWVTAAFSFGTGDNKKTYLDFPWTVEVMESKSVPGRFGLIEPFSSYDWVMNNSSNRKYGIFSSAIITIDCINPEFIVIPPQYTGYTMKAGAINADSDKAAYYMANRAGLDLSEGKTKEEIIADGRNDRLDGREIRIVKPQVHTSDQEGWGTWNTDPASRIIFDFDIASRIAAGTAEITLPDTDLPVEYFNLQGVRLTGEPAPGIYLRRRGSEVSKVIIR